MKSEVRKALAAIVIAVLVPLSTISQPHSQRAYTEDSPLVYEDAWDLWPYVFLDEHGQPEGYNIDILKELLRELQIPYVVKLKPTIEALEDLKDGRSDLMFRLAATFHDDYAPYGKEAVGLFTHSVVYPTSKNLDVKTLEDLWNHKVIVHTGSLSHRMLTERGMGSNIVPFDDMKEAIQKVSSEEEGLIVWNTQSLKWLMTKFRTQNLTMKPIDVPHGEYKFMSRDTVLLHKLDSAFVRLCSTERIQAIQNKWFFPERVDTGVPQWVVYVLVGAGLLAFLLAYYVIMSHFRERRMTRLIARHNKRLALILRTTKVRVWLYDLQTEKLVWLNDNGEMEKKEHSLSEYENDYTEETFSQMKESLAQIAAGRKDSCVQGLTGAGSQTGREYVLALSVFRRSRKGVPKVTVGMMDDQTERLLSQRRAKDSMLRYQSIFSTSMVDMTYYDTDGQLADINQKACQTFHCNRNELLRERVPFYFALEDSGLKIDTFEGCYSTHFLKSVGNENLANSIRIPRDMYYEQQLVPVYDSDNRFLGIFGSGRDVSEFVDSYHQLRQSIEQLKQAGMSVTEYINNINYALYVGGVRLANYSPRSHTLTIFKEMNIVQLTLTQSRCLSLIDDKQKRTAVRIFDAMDAGSKERIDVAIKTDVRAPGGHKLALQFSLMPITDEQGLVDSYFGLCRDISQEKATEEDLEREKGKAQEVENVKNAFLRNMSHEIRTPITTVVGFAQLFVEEHDPADEDGFIEEIKKNATFLLKLVNDVLFLSRLDAHMIEFSKTPIDFAYTFEGHCQMGWAKVAKPDVRYTVDNPYDHLVIDIDDDNVGHIIEQVAENASRYTDSGTVRARYDYIGDKLLITIEDTGKGLSREKLRSLFERFSYSGEGGGTGLGLPICQELAHQMGGQVYVNSAEGAGTTVYIVIPCKATLVEKKQLRN
jgi:signal transduction histidine kinase/ABC-type amino acid transport substrate-binding protein